MDKPLYLGFIFTSKVILSTSVGVTRYDTLLTPRTGYEHTIQASYDRDIYEVVIRETRRGSAASRVIERRPLAACGKT
jgi:hypothetical protein